MPKFNYVAMDSRGKETKGTLEVANQNEAIGRIKEMGFFPTKVVEDKGGPAQPGAKKTPAKGGKKGGGGGLNFQIKIPGLSGRVKSKVLDGLIKFGHFLPGQRSDPFHAVTWQVNGQGDLAEAVQFDLESRPYIGIRLEVRQFSGEQVSTLAGLGVFQIGKEVFKLI
jgi:hypothetical protein